MRIGRLVKCPNFLERKHTSSDFEGAFISSLCLNFLIVFLLRVISFDNRFEGTDEMRYVQCKEPEPGTF